MEVGLDESARGVLFGNIFASAVVLDDSLETHKWLNDSKKVTKKRRGIVREWVEENALYWVVSQVDNKIIDKINIKNANILAFELCVREITDNIKSESNSFINYKIDGIDFSTKNFGINDHLLTYVPPKMLDNNIQYENIIKGDSLFPSISAASILAKEHHDDYIRELIKQDPSLDEKYSLSTNMGYGTAAHMNGLKIHGKTDLHRTSFLKFLS
jgi:ribonuclease HII